MRKFRAKLDEMFRVADDQGRHPMDSKWGVYAFYDFDGEPIYVGQTNEQLRTRVRRHLTNQRTDAVAMRVLDVMEVAEVEVWPLWDLATIPPGEAHKRLDAAEYTAYLQAINKSRFRAILNEKIPPVSAPVALPQSLRFKVIDDDDRPMLEHPDVRIARRAETISRLADVVRERGEVSIGLRRVLLIQAIRLAYLSAERLAFTEGRPKPDPSSINASALVGSVLFEFDEPSAEGD